jgi:adenosine/AMP kinase
VLLDGARRPVPVIRQVPAVCGIYCATADPVNVVIAETAAGRRILGVVDGALPTGIETGSDVPVPTALVRQFGDKF